MIRLRLLGPMSLEAADGAAVRSVLDQPKRLALLAYLVAIHPPARHRRDVLVGLFWPEHDEQGARMNLRQTLHRLRRSLGRGVLEGTGRERIGVDSERLWCDAAAFTAALENGRSEAALLLYRGEFLQGFHLPDAPEFERWMDRERRRFRRRAAEAAWTLSDRTVTMRDFVAARRWADRALELAPYDDEAVRRYLELMDRLGQPATAVRAYEAYAARLEKELELEPSVETVRLIERIRRKNAERPPPFGDEGLEREPASLSPDASYTALTSAPKKPAKRPEQNDAKPGSRSRRSRVLALLLALVLVGVGGYTVFAGDAGSEETPTIRSLAVLPLQDLSTDRQQDYFVAGMQDALITELGKHGGLGVTSRTSSMRFANSGSSTPEIADALGVDAVIEGSVLRAGDQIRITLHLVDGSTDQQLWGGSFHRELRDILILQREVARAIAEEIGVAVDREGLPPVSSIEPEAYTHYLRGNAELKNGTEAAFQRALGHYRSAIAIDSAFAPPHAGLALAYIELGSWMASLPPAAVLPHARAAALAALERDPALAEAHIALGRIEHLFEWDWDEAETALRRGIELNPGSSHALWIYANYLISMGRFEEAVSIGKRLVDRDPLAATSYATLGWALDYLGRDEEALHQYREGLTVLPHPWARAVLLAEFHLKRGRADSAYAIAKRAEQAVGTDPAPMLAGLFGFIYGKADRADEARRILNALEARAERAYVPPNALAAVHVALGQKETALDLLERGFEVRDVTSVWHKVRWMWDPLRDEPRFQELLRRMDFPPTDRLVSDA